MMTSKAFQKNYHFTTDWWFILPAVSTYKYFQKKTGRVYFIHCKLFQKIVISIL